MPVCRSLSQHSVSSSTRSITIEHTSIQGMLPVLTFFFLLPSLASSKLILDPFEPYNVSPKSTGKLEPAVTATWSKELEGSETFWQDKTLEVGCNEEVAYMGFACEVDDCVAVEEPAGIRLL